MIASEMQALRDGLLEIEAALQSEAFPLVPLSATVVCFTGCLQGRWKCSWWKLSTLGKAPTPLAEVLSAMGRLFDRAVQELVSAKEKYLEACNQPSPKSLPALRRRILDLSEMLFPFWEHFTGVSAPFPGARSFLSLMGSSHYLCHQPTFETLRSLPIWVEMEAYTHQDIPLSLLLKGGRDNNWSPSEKRDLLRWGRALEREGRISATKLTLFFESVERFARSREGSDFSLPHLLLFLHNGGIKKWMGRDLSYLRWRVCLKEGTLLQMGDRTLTVGKALEEERHDNLFRHFTVQEEPDRLIRCGPNRLVNRFESVARESLQFGIRGIPESRLEEEGRFQLVTKLSQPMLTHTWKSQDWVLLPEEERIAAMLANHLYHQVSENFSLQGVSLKHVFLDGIPPVLRACCLVKKKSACYLAWEEFAALLAKGNTPVLHFLVHVSLLSSHPLYCYFTQIGRFSLKTGKTNLLSTPLPSDWEGPSYSSRAEALASSAMQARKEAIERIQHRNLEEEAPTEETLSCLEERVSSLLVSFYEAHPTPSTLPTDLIEKVERQWTESKKTGEKSITGSGTYYRKQHQELQSRNKIALSSS